MSHSPRPRRNARGPHVYRRGAVWYAYLPERPKGVSLGVRTEAEARVKLRELLAAGVVTPPDRSRPVELSLAECAREWLDAPHGYTTRTRQSHRERIRAWVIWCEETAHVQQPREVTPAVVDRWITERSAVVSRRTVNRDIRSVKVCLRWAAERGLCLPVAAVAVRAILAPWSPSVRGACAVSAGVCGSGAAAGPWRAWWRGRRSAAPAGPKPPADHAPRAATDAAARE